MHNDHSLLRILFGEQREFFKTVGVEPYGSFGPDSRYFQSTSNEGWRRYLIQLIGSDNRTEALKHVNEVIARRVVMMAKPEQPISVELDMSSPEIPMRVEDLEVPETFDIRFGDKIFTVTGVKEDKKATALMDKAVETVMSESQTQLDGIQSEYASNLQRVVKDFEQENRELRARFENVLPALLIPESLLLEGVRVTSSDHEHRLYIPMKLTYKRIIFRSGKYEWEIDPEHVETFDTYLMVAVDKDLHVRWTYIYDRDFRKRIPIWHVSGGALCLGTYEPRMSRLEDLLQVRRDIQKMLEKINLDSLGTTRIEYSEKQEDLLHSIRSWRDQFEMYEHEEIDEEPEMEFATKVGAKAWTA